MIKIKKALTLPATLLGAICWIIVSLIIYFYTANLLLEAFENHTFEKSKNLLATIRNDFITGNYLRIRGQFANFVRESESDFVMITDNHGVPIEWVFSDLRSSQNSIPLELVHSAFGEDYLVYEMPLTFRNIQNQPLGTLIVVHNKKELNAQLKQLWVFLGVMLIVSLMSQTVILHLVSQRIIKPLLQLISSIKTSAKERWMIPLTVQSSIHEFGELKFQYNEMIQKVQSYHVEVNRFEQLAAIGEIAAQVAHDIRSPLSSIQAALGYLGQMKIEDPKSVDVLNLLQLSTKRLTGIANDLLKKHKGGVALPGRFSIHQVLDELIGEFQAQELYQQIKFVKEYALSAIYLDGNVAKIQRAFGNIIKNGAEAMQFAGKITLRIEENGEHAVISIHDTGPGMTPEKLERVLQGGFTEGKKEGHGIGMKVVKETIEEHGGKVWGKSIVGRETTFFVEFANICHKNISDVFALTVFAKEPVLVVDDDPSLREQWKFILKEQGVQVTLSNSMENLQKQNSSSSFTQTAIVDYHFENSEKNGVDIIRYLQQIGFENLYLCTAEYWKPSIQKLAQELQVQLCPKPLPAIKVEFITKKEHLQQNGEGLKVLVVDDDEAIRSAWELVQNKLNIQQLYCYPNLEALQQNGADLKNIDLAFVDKNIQDSAYNGAEVVEYLSRRAVKKIILASGENADVLRKDPQYSKAHHFIDEKIPKNLEMFFN